MEHLDPTRTTWHITWGTYGARLHGDERPNVDRQHNQPGQAFLMPDPGRREAEANRMTSPVVMLTVEQCLLIQAVIPELCVRGGWTYRVASAGEDHVHVLVDLSPQVHGEKARRLLKRWVTQALNERWPREGAWWAEEGSNKPVKEQSYLNNAFEYISRQRAKGASA